MSLLFPGRASLVALIALGIQAGGASAQVSSLADLDLEDLTEIQVNSASKFSQPLREAPAAVQVVSREEIRRYGWRTLSEALGAFAGTHVNTDRAYDFIGIRGLAIPGDYNTRVLLLIDGTRTNDVTFAQAMLGQELGIDLSLIERIEFIPGSGSAIYGSSAMLGVINIITRKAEEMPPLAAGTLITSDGWREARANGVQRFDSGASLTLSYAQGNRASEGVNYPEQATSTHKLDSQQIQRFFARYQTSKLTLTAQAVERSVRPSSALYGALNNDNGLLVTDGNYNLAGVYADTISDIARYEARLSYARTTYRGDYPYDNAGTRYLNHDDAVGEGWLLDTRFFYDGIRNHRLLLGFEGQAIESRQRNYDLDAFFTTPADIRSRSRRLGLYVQDEWHFAEDWRLSMGLRHDAVSDSEGSTNPRLGLIWLPTPTTTLKLLAGSAYRQPNHYERDFYSGTTYLSNPDLRGEKIRSVEAVAEQALDRTHRVSLSLFNYSLRRLIQQNELTPGIGSYQYINTDTIDARGVELLWRSRWPGGTRLDASVAYSETQNSENRTLDYTPRWLGKVRGMLPVWQDRWWLAADAEAISGVDYRWQSIDRHQPGQLLLNCTLSGTRVLGGFDVHLRARNLLDRRYAYPASQEVGAPAVPGYGRIWELMASYAF